MSEQFASGTVFLAMFCLALALGFTAHRTQFCTMGAVSDWIILGDKGRLAAWFLAIAVAILGVIALEASGVASVDQTRPNYRSPRLDILRHVIGGFLFGIGMTLAGGCTTKTLVRIGAGNMKSLVVFGVVGVFAYLMTSTEFYTIGFASWLEPLSINLADHAIKHQDLGSVFGWLTGSDQIPALRITTGIVIAAAIILWAWLIVGFSQNRNNWLAGTIVGLCIAASWLLTGGPIGEVWIEAALWADEPQPGVGVQSFTFVNPIGQSLVFLSNPTQTGTITVGVIAVAGTLVGAFVSAWSSRQLRLEWFPNWADFTRHLVGGALMGIGGILALGCTVGQGISGTSTLALGAFISLAAIIAGGVLTLKIQFYRLMRA